MGKREIYLQLKAAGMNHNGACAIMGNFQAESALRANNVEDRAPYSDADYTAMVDNGSYSAEQFRKDGYGYGLYQITYPQRKANFLAFCKARGKSIADESTQVAFAVKELTAEYPTLWTYLQVTTNLYKATERVCKEFERPAINNVEERYSHAQNFSREFSGTAPTQDELDEIEAINQSATSQETAPAESNRLRGKLSNETVGVLQIICQTYGYDIGPSGPDSIIGPRIKAALSQFTHDFMEI